MILWIEVPRTYRFCRTEQTSAARNRVPPRPRGSDQGGGPPLSFRSHLGGSERRWWNAYWEMYRRQSAGWCMWFRSGCRLPRQTGRRRFRVRPQSGSIESSPRTRFRFQFADRLPANVGRGVAVSGGLFRSRPRSRYFASLRTGSGREPNPAGIETRGSDRYQRGLHPLLVGEDSADPLASRMDLAAPCPRDLSR